MKNTTLYLIIVSLCTYNSIAFSLRDRLELNSEENGSLLELSVEDFERAIAKNLQFATNKNAYWLYTRRNPSTAQIIENGNAISLWTSNYDSSKPLKVIAHGWNRDGTAPVNTMVTSAFLDVGDVNVLVVDWREDASGDYFAASASVPAAGQALGNFLEWLINTGGGNWNNVHLIGYSLGAHMVGNAGRQVQGQPRRVTGLDPAGPFWSNNYALNTNSGQYVEVVHTNILGRGITEPLGHVDFYPNGGHRQPGCDTNRCSHSRSYELFASSIRTNHFVGRQCTDVLQAILNQCNGSTFSLGNGVLSKNGNGIYGLTTTSSWPF